MPFELISVNKPKFATNTQPNRFVDFFFYKLIYYVNNFFGRFHINIIHNFFRGFRLLANGRIAFLIVLSCNVKARSLKNAFARRSDSN